MTDLLRRLEVLAEGIELSRAVGWNNIAAALRGIIAAEKARGPDPLLEQARKYMSHRWDCVEGDDPYESCTCGLSAAIAALDAKLGGKS